MNSFVHYLPEFDGYITACGVKITFACERPLGVPPVLWTLNKGFVDCPECRATFKSKKARMRGAL